MVIFEKVKRGEKDGDGGNTAALEGHRQENSENRGGVVLRGMRTSYQIFGTRNRSTGKGHCHAR